MQPNQPNQPNNPKKLRIELPNNLEVIYGNAAMVTQTHSEIVMDVLQVLPNDPRAKVKTRVVMTPANAKMFLKALQQNLDRYESKHGEINTPPTPTTLADQLFGVVKPDDDAPDDSSED